MYDLRDLVAVGRSAKVQHVVRESDAAATYSKGLEELMSTPALLSLAIQVSANAIDQYLPEGYISIGRSIEFEHTAPTRVGTEITIEATVVDVQPLYIVLELKAGDELGSVGFGKHKRSIVAQNYFLERSERRAAQMINNRHI